MKVILTELGGVPHLDNEELKDARETAITLELTNRFAVVHGDLWTISQYMHESLNLSLIKILTRKKKHFGFKRSGEY
jgi:hypothetical protein